MTWQAPWAWIGSVTLALPILIHLLGQRKARRLQFPSLQFFGTTRPLPTRRTKLHDIALLVVRCLILVAALAALAQPLLLTQRRTDGFNDLLARAVIVDTSSSMRRRVVTGEPAVDAALHQAQLLVDSATTGVALRTSTPARAIAGAVAWLGRHGGRGEIVVISDFQPGTIDSADIAAIPANIGIRIVPMHIAPATGPLAIYSDVGSQSVTTQIALLPDRTDLEWSARPALFAEEHESVSLLAAPAESSSVAAVRRAAATIGVLLPIDWTRSIAVAYPDLPGRAAVLRNAKPLAPWMTDVVVRLRADPALLAAASPATPLPDADTATSSVIVRNAEGRVLVRAAGATIDGQEQLLLLPLIDVSSPTSAALAAAAHRAIATRIPPSELDPTALPESTLATWQRPPTARATPGPGADGTDGRWFWVAALGLLAIEWLVRHRMTSTSAAEVARGTAG